jgi:hypothetical protein
MPVQYGGDKITFSDGSTVGSGWTGFKNRIINGDMGIDQRNSGASFTPANGGADYIYTLDRWRVYSPANSKFSVQQNAGSVTPPIGFTNYLGVTSLAATSVGAGDVYLLSQTIEGFNTADFMWGTANAQTITLSFWVRSSLTGTFGGSLQNGAFNRSYPFSYTISAANTWEQKSVTIAGDTTGTWLTTNGRGIQLFFSLGSGSSFSGTAGTWAGANLFSSTGATSVVGTNGATFYITGVQLERGSTATSFDYLPYGTELSLCYRYFYRINASVTTSQLVALGFQMSASTTSQMTTYPKVTMRASPTISITNLAVSDYTSWGASATSVSGQYASPDVIQMQITHGSGGSSFRPAILHGGGATNSYLDMSVEL